MRPTKFSNNCELQPRRVINIYCLNFWHNYSISWRRRKNRIFSKCGAKFEMRTLCKVARVIFSLYSRIRGWPKRCVCVHSVRYADRGRSNTLVKAEKCIYVAATVRTVHKRSSLMQLWIRYRGPIYWFLELLLFFEMNNWMDTIYTCSI